MNLRYVDEHEKNNELVRTKTNSSGVSSYRVRCVRCYFFSYQRSEEDDKKQILKQLQKRKDEQPILDSEPHYPVNFNFYRASDIVYERLSICY